MLGTVYLIPSAYSIASFLQAASISTCFTPLRLHYQEDLYNNHFLSATTTAEMTGTRVDEAMSDGKEEFDVGRAPAEASSKESSIKPEDSDTTPEWKPGRGLYLAFLAMAVLTLMVALDGTSLSVALPIIAQTLHGSALEAFWSGTSFLLASTVFQPSFAQLSHVLGRVQMTMFAITLFFVGVMMAALTKNFSLLLAGRTVQGIGGGGIIALTEIMLTDLVPLRHRGAWGGIIAAMWSLGSVSGMYLNDQNDVPCLQFRSCHWRRFR